MGNCKAIPPRMAAAMNTDTSPIESPISFAKTAPMLFSEELAIPAQIVPNPPTGEMANNYRNFMRCGELSLGALARISTMGTRARE